MAGDFTLAEATIASIHDAYVARELSAVELVKTYLQRIETYDRAGQALNSVVVSNVGALSRAEELDAAGELTGPLHGIPVVLKDNIGYLAHFAARHEFTLAVLNAMAPVDALAYPSVQVPPPTLAGRADWTTLTLPTNTLIASQTWLPAITVPAGFTGDGAPVGLELVGRPYAEATLFSLAHGFEQATRYRTAPESCP
jgi:amidase